MPYDNTNKIAIFKIDDKKNANGPDYNGTVNINGKEFRVSLWKRIAKNSGKSFLSGEVGVEQRQKATSPAPKDDSEEIPF